MQYLLTTLVSSAISVFVSNIGGQGNETDETKSYEDKLARSEDQINTGG